MVIKKQRIGFAIKPWLFKMKKLVLIYHYGSQKSKEPMLIYNHGSQKFIFYTYIYIVLHNIQ
jgi:hypothetical protein